MPYKRPVYLYCHGTSTLVIVCVELGDSDSCVGWFQSSLFGKKHANRKVAAKNLQGGLNSQLKSIYTPCFNLLSLQKGVSQP